MIFPRDSRTKAALEAIYRVARTGNPDVANLPDLGFDEAFVDQVAPLMDFLWDRYFRVKMTGVENIPTSGPVMLVVNHSGGLPYDGALLMHGIRRAHPSHRPVRAMVANFAFRNRLMAPIVSRFGGVRASIENGVSLLNKDQVVAVFPEGLRGVGKLFRERYRLTRFGRGGFVRLARLTGAPIIPIAVVGAEEIHPIIGKIHKPARALGLPFIPITPTFPFLGPLGLLPLPTKWSIQVGKPVTVDKGPPLDESQTLEMAEGVRKTVDHMIAQMLLDRRSIFFG